MRHINYGVAEPHWPVLGQALDLTLRDVLGPAYTPEVQHAWTTVYGYMSALMIQGLRTAIQERDMASAAASQQAADASKLTSTDSTTDNSEDAGAAETDADADA
mmetsp:Transcript_70029/g.202983  ORF Transcript_70029/g.202983 Transcript_70029/m.202983 type:complete len:104 (-) Transcript_70029:200-511(-)